MSIVENLRLINDKLNNIQKSIENLEFLINLSENLMFIYFFPGLGTEIKMNIDINFSIIEIHVLNIDINFDISKFRF